MFFLTQRKVVFVSNAVIDGALWEHYIGHQASNQGGGN